MPVEMGFSVGGEREVRRLGYGAMRIVGPNVWGPPADWQGALNVLRRARELGVNFIDTADAYGLGISERLIKEALNPYGSVCVGTKAGLLSTGPAFSEPPACGRPAYLRQQLELSLRRLGVDHLDLWQLHRIDPEVPAADQFGVLKQAVDDGKVRHVGLSGVSVDEVHAARQIVPIATVQNLYNLSFRESDPLLSYCEANGIGFIPFFPLHGGGLVHAEGALAAIARRHEASVSQLALAWLLHRSPNLIPIPGTSSVAHLEENVAAAELSLSKDDLVDIDAAVLGAGSPS